MKDYILARLKEPSTYRGLVLCLTACGIVLDSTQIEAITFIGLFITGMLGVATPDKGSSNASR